MRRDRERNTARGSKERGRSSFGQGYAATISILVVGLMAMDQSTPSSGIGTRIFLLMPRIFGLASIPWFRWGEGQDWGPSIVGGAMMWFLTWCLVCIVLSLFVALARMVGILR